MRKKPGLASSKNSKDYPFYVPFLRNLFNISLFSMALWILMGLHNGLALLYGLYCLAATIVIMPKLRCTRCFYYGHRCSTAFGLFSRLLYRKDQFHSFTEGIWHNIFLLPIGLFPLGGALWRIFFWRDNQSIWSCLGFVAILAGLLIEHATLGCKVCRELKGCPARWVIGPIKPLPPDAGHRSIKD